MINLKFNKNFLIWPLSIIGGAVLGLILLAWLNPFRIFVAKKDNTWIISQGLANTLSKQVQLKNAVDASGSVSLLDIVKIATSTGVPKAEVVRKGNETYLSTGPIGEVSVDMPYGEYAMAVIPVPGVDFTNVPDKIYLSKPVQEVKLTLKEGTGQIKGIKSTKITQIAKDKLSKLVIKLVRDNDIPVLWAGVSIKLTKK